MSKPQAGFTGSISAWSKSLHSLGGADDVGMWEGPWPELLLSRASAAPALFFVCFGKKATPGGAVGFGATRAGQGRGAGLQGRQEWNRKRWLSSGLQGGVGCGQQHGDLSVPYPSCSSLKREHKRADLHLPGEGQA